MWHVIWLLLDTGLLYFQDFKNYIVNTHTDHNKTIAWECEFHLAFSIKHLVGFVLGGHDLRKGLSFDYENMA